MRQHKVYRAIGLMSGTSLDGIDAALIETDGHDHVRPLDFATFPYDEALRARLRACLGRKTRDAEMLETEREMTLLHAEILRGLGWRADITGFHGQTVFHAPQEGLTLQIGDAALLARETRIDTVSDFRGADVRAGGQGAPLLPLYHRARAMAGRIETPLAVLNIGGVANVTWIGREENNLLAFDTGPGNALIDDFIFRRTGQAFDRDGALAASGAMREDLVAEWLSHSYFARRPPKSLDRDAWNTDVESLGDADGAATLTAFTARSIIAALAHMPEKPSAWHVTGGGRHNRTLMRMLADALGGKVDPVEELGWNGDALEAEGFAWLAVRSLLKLPLSLPSTTGVPAPQTGGTLYRIKP